MGYSMGHQENSQEFSGKSLFQFMRMETMLFPQYHVLSSVFNRKTEVMISSCNSTYPPLIISICGVLCLGPSGVGVNELRRQLIELDPNRFQSAVPRTFTFSFIGVHVLVELSLPLQMYSSHLTMLYHLCCKNIRHKR